MSAKNTYMHFVNGYSARCMVRLLIKKKGVTVSKKYLGYTH